MSTSLTTAISISIPSQISSEKHINDIVLMLEEIDSVLIDLKESNDPKEKIVYSNSRKRFQDIVTFMKNIIIGMSDTRINKIIKEDKVMQNFDNFNFIQNIRLFVIGSIYYSDKLYEYTRQKRDTYIQKLFQFMLRYQELENHCNNYNNTLSEIKKLIVSIDNEIISIKKRISEFRIELEQNPTKDEERTLNDGIKKMETTMETMKEQRKQFDTMKKEYDVKMSHIQILIPFYQDFSSILDEIIPREFADEFNYYHEHISFIWKESTLSSHNNNLSRLIIRSAFDD